MLSPRFSRARSVAMTATVGLGVLVTLTVAAPAASASSVTFTPVADTYVQQDQPTTNFGQANEVVVDNAPVRRILLKFTVSGLSGSVARATLRLHLRDTTAGPSPHGGTVRQVGSSSWAETTVTWNSQPAIDGATLGSFGAVMRNTWYEMNVTPVVTGNNTFTLAFTSADSDGAHYDSRESGANAPQLVVTSGAIPSDPVLVGAADIASCASSGDEATATLVDAIPGTVFTAGDNAYPAGSSFDFTNCYQRSWGRHKWRTRPAAGNHEYATGAASGYFGYFGAAAGPIGKGYYSYDLGGWHVIVLNSNCSSVGGCQAGSAQEQWLRQDLRASTKPCTAAIWHHPRYTSGYYQSTEMRPIWQALYDANAEVIVNGHMHQYERFAPQDPAGNRDLTRGIREFVAGTGGASHYSFTAIQPNSEARNSDTYGVLKLTLHGSGYDWEFVPVAGKTYRDSGSGICH